MAEWEGLAARQYPDPVTPAGAPAEVADAARAVVARRRAEWVEARLRAPSPKKYSNLDADFLHVGDAGYLPGGHTTVRIDDGTVVFRTAAGTLFGFSGLDTSTMVSDRRYTTDEVVECYRTAKFGLYTLPVVRHKSTAGVRDPVDVDAHQLALRRVEAAVKVSAEARGRLAKVKDAALDKALAAAAAEARYQIPVATTGPAEVQIKTRIAFEKLDRELRDEARRKVEAVYIEPPLPE